MGIVTAAGRGRQRGGYTAGGEQRWAAAEVGSSGEGAGRQQDKGIAERRGNKIKGDRKDNKIRG